MSRILAINGSYRSNGITDQSVNALTEAAEAAGAVTETVLLRRYPVEFCLNCRRCTQEPGDAPGECVLNDGMQELIDRMELADGYIFASPTNFGTVTAVFKRFMERLIVYAYWPWDMRSPSLRKAKLRKKKAVLVSSCAAPGIIGRLFHETHRQLRMTAQVTGARTVGTLFTGLTGREQAPVLPERACTRIVSLAERLI
ncbi:MAG: flavodoxin family protein [Deferribacteres bacterium]|nr:flavodoxin family protein [Deferribacteres bacterium]